MTTQIILEVVQHTEDPLEAWSYCDQLIQQLHLKDYYQESDMTPEQKLFLGHIIMEYFKALYPRLDF